MKNGDNWALVDEKMEELRGLVDEQWENGGWEMAALGERVLKTMGFSKCATGCLRKQNEAFQAAAVAFVQTAGTKVEF